MTAGREANDEPLAVLTGDIVRSSTLERAELGVVTALIENTTAAFEALYPGSVVGAPDVYRGDSWQVAVSSPRYSLRLAVLLRAGVIASGAADTRVSIGIGAGNTVVDDRISQSTGDAFLRSGRGLDDIAGRRMALSMPDAPPDIGALARSVVLLLDHVIGGWTAKQAGAMRRVMENPGKPDADIADARTSDSVRRNFTKLKNRASAELVLDVLGTFENLDVWGRTG